MYRLIAARHTAWNDSVIEIWDDDRLAGVIYPTDKGIRVISKYLTNSALGLLLELAYPPALNIDLTADGPSDSPAPTPKTPPGDRDPSAGS